MHVRLLQAVSITTSRSLLQVIEGSPNVTLVDASVTVIMFFLNDSWLVFIYVRYCASLRDHQTSLWRGSHGKHVCLFLFIIYFLLLGCTLQPTIFTIVLGGNEPFGKGDNQLMVLWNQKRKKPTLNDEPPELEFSDMGTGTLELLVPLGRITIKHAYESDWNRCTIPRALTEVLFNQRYFAAKQWKIKLLFVNRRLLLPLAGVVTVPF